jgi:microcystin degradation protein MlrC
MLTDGFLFNHSISFFQEFDQRRERLYPLDVSPKTRRTVTLSLEIVEAAKQRGMKLADYILQLHQNQRSARVAYVSSLYRGFALLEMARVPIDPAYFDLVDGCMSADESREFRILASSGEDHALVRAAAQLLGADTRRGAVQALLLAASRSLEATFYR